jgi:hypothetical protein
VPKYHGRRGQIQIGASSPLEIICSLSSWNLSFTRDKTDVTSFCNTNKAYLVGLKDVSGGFEGFFDTDDFRDLFEAADSATGTNIKITPSLDAPDYYFEGPCWLDLSVTGSVSDAIKVSGTLSANGVWVAVLGGSAV